ncbi:hypothetical protein GCM10025865_18960 [Paraoerskovia sediminicola]|uniref:tRNA(Ile)-lysidine/2-thiocytidine synthase N-terminal domain-containing protein n=1 Tax=Paraoerskovia sediminicola TaxID=1138587 RepID=A0ABM8G3K2_9CELL|nr:hypothetical protein GCM10025865_18960 [Paraoerskovia sediminicola]
MLRRRRLLALAAAAAFEAASSRRRASSGAPGAWRAGAIVVDHGLQVGSRAVAERAAEQCRSLGLDPVEVVPVAVGEHGGSAGPEGRARGARYAALADAATRHGASAVLLGHTLDDQAESVLLGLARGSGPARSPACPPCGACTAGRSSASAGPTRRPSAARQAWIPGTTRRTG